MYRRFVVCAMGLGLALLGGSVSFGQFQQQDQTGTAAQGGGLTLGGLDLGTGMTTGSERFLQQNREAGQFVGGGFRGVGSLRSQPGMDGTGGAARGQTGALGMGQFGMMGMNSPMNTLNNLYAASMLNNLSRQRRPLRMPVTVGIEPTPALVAAAQPANVAQRVQSKLVKIPQVRDSGSVSVAMEGKVAVVRGKVKSQRDRDLIGRMLLLEPGVADVRNELVVASPVPAP